MVRPRHIQPEWYFLSYYSILRVVPRKLAGVFCFGVSVLIYFFLPCIKAPVRATLNRGVVGVILFICNECMLIRLAAHPVENPFIFIAQVCGVVYFLVVFCL